MQNLLEIIKSKTGLLLLFVALGLITVIFFRQTKKPLLPATFSLQNQGIQQLGVYQSAYTQPWPAAGQPATYDIFDAKKQGGTQTCVCPLDHRVVLHNLSCSDPCPLCHKTMMNAVYAGDGHLNPPPTKTDGTL